MELPCRSAPRNNRLHRHVSYPSLNPNRRARKPKLPPQPQPSFLGPCQRRSRRRRCQRAARALRRSATHAVTAAAVHWHYPHNTRRRLHIVISRLMCDGLLENTHQRTLRQVYQLSDIVAGSSIPAASSVPDSLRAMRRARRRVSRLITAVTSAMVADPNPITLEKLSPPPAAPVNSATVPAATRCTPPFLPAATTSNFRRAVPEVVHWPTIPLPVPSAPGSPPCSLPAASPSARFAVTIPLSPPQSPRGSAHGLSKVQPSFRRKDVTPHLIRGRDPVILI